MDEAGERPTSASANRPLGRMVPRDLPPLPSAPLNPARGSRVLPRRAARKLDRETAVGRRVNDCAAALANTHGDGDVCSEAALKELLDQDSLGCNPDGPTAAAPRDRDLVARPESAGRVSLLEALPEPDRQEVIDGESSPLFRADEVRPGAAKVHCDKTLRNNRDERVAFVQDLPRRDMAQLRARRDFEIRVFSAKKKAGNVRLIVDARAVNQALKRPTSTHSASTAALAGLGAEPDDQLAFSLQDIADCFFQLRAPAHRELLRDGGLGGIESELERRRLAPGARAQPAPRAAHVDDEISASSQPGATKQARRQAAAAMAQVGLPLREVEAGQSVAEAPGMELDGVQLKARLARAKRRRLLRGTRALLRRRRVAGQEVEKLTGHFTHAMLLGRPALSAFRSARDFGRRHYRGPVALWPSARQELVNAMNLLPVLMVEPSLPRPGPTTCSDATLKGYAAQ
ncbi:unnamed protein product, partial [Prorocentrum cordatum]